MDSHTILENLFSICLIPIESIFALMHWFSDFNNRTYSIAGCRSRVGIKYNSRSKHENNNEYLFKDFPGRACHFSSLFPAIPFIPFLQFLG